MTFLSPERLIFLVVAIAFGGFYIVLQKKRSSYALRFASSELLESVMPSSPGVRRHIPAATFLLALTVLILGFAEPAANVRVPRERATVIVAIDVSLSMEATDVEPDRISAAQAAANRFVDEIPPKINVGIVAFAGSANVVLPPTTDREKAHIAINNLKLAESTAIGEAIFTSLDALANTPGDDSEEPIPARIVLLSDGETTVGRSDSSAVEAARDANVPISTIAFGTATGVVFYDDPRTAVDDRQIIPVPVSEKNLEDISDASGGEPFTASSLEELDAVYNDIGSAIGFESVKREISDWFIGAGLLLLASAAGLSLAWFQRLP